MKRAFTCCSGDSAVLDALVPQQEIGAVYDRIAPLYDIWGTLTESRARMRAIELAGVRNGETVLEVAVGTGLAFRELALRNPEGRNIGIDLSPRMLERAKRRLGMLSGARYELAVGSALELPLGTATIDRLVNSYLFDLLSDADMDRALAEFRRVLKPGGKLILVNMTKSETFMGGIYEALYRLSPRLMGGCRGVRLVVKLAQQGFTVELREYCQQMLFPSEIISAHART